MIVAAAGRHQGKIVGEGEKPAPFGIGLVGVSFAFGLSVVTMAYAIGHISGCHLNPAVTVGLAAGGRFPAGQIAPYVIAQVIVALKTDAERLGVAAAS